MSDLLRWWLATELIGLAALPYAFRLFCFLPDRGIAFARPLGLLLVGYTLWLGGFAGLPPDGGTAALLLAALTAGGLWLAGRDRRTLLSALRARGRYIILTEALFLLAFVGYALLRAYSPDIAGTEKPFESAFFQAVLQSPRFTPRDPWYSGEAMSYYYFGYVLLGVVTHLTATAPAVAFNLGLALTGALTAVAAYGLVYNLTRLRGRVRPATALLVALLGPLCLLLVSNFEGVFELLSLHGVSADWFYQAIAIHGLDGPQSSHAWYPTSHWWWWRATRLGSDWNVEEFPFFSFLLGDLHAHVMVLPYSLLMLAGSLHLLIRPGFARDAASAEPDGSAGEERRALVVNEESAPDGGESESLAAAVPEEPSSLPPLSWRYLRDHPWPALTLALCAGALYVTNAWDFPTALVLLGLLILARNVASGARLHVRMLLNTISLLLPIAALAVLLYLPFYIGFAATPTELRATEVLHGETFIGREAVATPPFQFFVFWGPLLFPTLSYLIWRVRSLRPWRLDPALFALGLAVGIVPLLVWAAAVSGANGLDGLRLELQARGHLVLTWFALVPFVIMAALVLFGEVFLAEERTVQPSRLFLAAAILTGYLLILFPELFFIIDIVVLSRHNTVFKFYYSAWLLLSVGGAAGVIDLVSSWRRRERRSVDGDSGWTIRRTAGVVGRSAWVGGGLILLALALIYPVTSTLARMDEWSGPPTLNGLAGLRRYQPEEYAAARWLQENARGQPVLLEAAGPEYSLGARVSGRTGLPTVVGWVHHEWQERGVLPPVEARVQDVKTLYTSSDANVVRALLARYDIRFIYLAEYERQLYGGNAGEALARISTLVFQNGPVAIYAAPPVSTPTGGDCRPQTGMLGACLQR